MLSAIKVNLSPQEIIDAVKAMKKRARDAFLEDLLAATSPEYLESIREARRDYKAGRIKTHEEVFGRWYISLFTPGELSEISISSKPISKNA
jgi:hypothetical protein